MEQGERRMTNEELKQEAKIYSYKLYHSKAWNPGEDMLVKAYLAGAEPREKRIAELEAQIEKMKCCENCKYYNNHYNEVVCKRQVINCKRILRQATRDQWEIKENE